MYKQRDSWYLSGDSYGLGWDVEEKILNISDFKVQ